MAFTSVPLNENDIPVPVTPTEDKPEEDQSVKSENTNMFDSYCMVYNPDGSEEDVNYQVPNQIRPTSIGNIPEKRHVFVQCLFNSIMRVTSDIA